MGIMQHSYVKYGLMMCGLIGLCLLLMELTGQNLTFDKSPLLLVFQFLGPAVIWWFGISEKKKQLGGKLTFKQGFREGFMISLVFGLVSPFVFLAYYVFINPGIVDYVRSVYGLMNEPVVMVVGIDLAAQFVSAILFGSVYGGIISLLLRTKSK